MPGPVFCCASAGIEAVMALSNTSAQNTCLMRFEPIAGGVNPIAKSLRPDGRSVLVKFIAYSACILRRKFLNTY